MTRLPSALELLQAPLEALEHWKSEWPVFETDETLAVPEEKAKSVLLQLVDRLRENYPFFHPDYAGQMLKPPHALASIAYFIAQQINPNNHALDGGPATARMEYEVTAELARMFGYKTFLGHLTSSGTIANLEALWIARSLHPQRAIAFSREAHYTHSRMCELIGARSIEIAVDSHGRMDVDDLSEKLRTGEIGTVVATTGTTPLGAVDPLDKILELRSKFDFRVHVDAAYGGFLPVACGFGRRPGTGRCSRFSCNPGIGQCRRRSAQTWYATIWLRFYPFPRPVDRAVLQARLTVHVLHFDGPSSW